MNTNVKEGAPWHGLHLKHPVKNRLPWGVLFHTTMFVLGMGCIGWALVNIWANNAIVVDPQAYVTPVNPSSIALENPGNQAWPATTGSAVFEAPPVEGALMGSLWIPVLDKRLPIYQGTGTEELKKGVGHFSESVMPGMPDNCVLSGHRDSVFSELGQLKRHDLLVVEDPTGKFTYEVTGTRIVDKDDRTVIVPADHAMLTLTTCYPFSYIGSAPERYIVTADLLEVTVAVR